MKRRKMEEGGDMDGVKDGRQTDSTSWVPWQLAQCRACRVNWLHVIHDGRLDHIGERGSAWETREKGTHKMHRDTWEHVGKVEQGDTQDRWIDIRRFRGTCPPRPLCRAELEAERAASAAMREELGALRAELEAGRCTRNHLGLFRLIRPVRPVRPVRPNGPTGPTGPTGLFRFPNSPISRFSDSPILPIARTGRTGRISRNSPRWFRAHLPGRGPPPAMRGRDAAPPAAEGGGPPRARGGPPPAPARADGPPARRGGEHGKSEKSGNSGNMEKSEIGEIGKSENREIGEFGNRKSPVGPVGPVGPLGRTGRTGRT
eukprot:gene13943-biopygen11279